MKNKYYELFKLTQVVALSTLVFYPGIVHAKPIPAPQFKLVNNGTKVNGKVTNEAGEPIEGVMVFVKNTNVWVETDKNGAFTIDYPFTTATILTFSAIGYTEVEYTYKNENNIKIRLQHFDEQLDEVVITALGIKREEKQLGYAQQKIEGDEFTTARSNNWVDNMKGKVAGMSFTSASSGPMNSTQVVLRGNRSINANNNGALIVVDGIPINTNMSASTASAGYLSADSPVDFGSGLSDINPDDIENVTILKGAGATALYGSRAANGAIMITTKSGKRNQGLGVTFNTNTSFEVIQRWPNWQTQYGSGSGKIRNTAGDLYYSYGDSADGMNTVSNLGFGPKFDGQYYYQYDPNTGMQGTEKTLWQNYNNARKGYWKTGSTLTNSIQFQGGDDKGSIRASITNLKNEWIMPNTGFDRTNVSMKADYQISKAIKLNTSVNYSNRYSDNLPSTGYNNHSISYFMILTNPNDNIDWYKKMWLDDGKTQLNSPFSPYIDNPYAITYEVINSNKNNTITGNIHLDIDLAKNLKLMVRSGLNLFNERRELKRPYDLVKFPTGYYEQQHIQSREINSDFLLTYTSKKDQDFQYNFSVGGNTMTNNFYRLDASANGLSVPDVYKLSNAANGILTNSADRHKKVNSLYALGSFSYRNLVFLDLTARNDWSSTLPAHNNSYFYPSANLSTIVSDLFVLPSFIDFAKWRVSIAEVGKDSDPYIISKYYDLSDFTSSAQVDNSLFNINLKPELTTSFETGIDLRFFGNRLGFDGTFYRTVSENQIISVPTDYSTGYSNKFINAGKVLNRGVEATLFFVPVQTEDFEWRSTVTYAKNHNEILSLAEGIEGGDQQTLATSGTVSIIGKVGGTTGDLYGYGFVRNDAGQIIYNEKTGLPVRPTKTQYIGNAYADWKGGWSNQFSYKNFTLGFTLDGSFGGTLYSQSFHKLMEHGKLNESLMGREQGFIIGDGVIQNADGSFSPNTTKVDPSTYYADYYRRANVESNSFDATWVKLREVSFGYSFPKETLDRWKLKDLRISVFGRNLYTWSDFPIYDPETAALNGSSMVPGVEMGQLPSPATYGFNIKVSL
ncbi:SusC/RagA family TonB-linked outer membrane protein [Flavobacterium agricola]|uniref:SusC/RagA family TonB-linked outer membrane protein n=1 Tax=Flavobacterium agricola TaxID=2870839 RepID=A0ABY6LXV1_9FLAO|nr:SusC/RagA family TonB-linked outer membrane protein [Flavobacterium agricola]UYW01006.1 SusC/RagA family TonB-linked outer membrane protein [Flavobacterium agricola]